MLFIFSTPVLIKHLWWLKTVVFPVFSTFSRQTPFRRTLFRRTLFRLITTWDSYCIEGTEMRQRGFKVRRLLFLNRYILFQRAAAILILERKEGEIGK